MSYITWGTNQEGTSKMSSEEYFGFRYNIATAELQESKMPKLRKCHVKQDDHMGNTYEP